MILVFNFSIIFDILTFDFSTLNPDMKVVQNGLSEVKNDLTSMTSAMKSMNDPARFSCSVTSDEIRTPGVITYSTCNINSEAMMNKNTGHITVKDSGDYFLSFTANMVSVNSQAIWCAIYKQSPGSDGWQVLGTILNTGTVFENYSKCRI